MAGDWIKVEKATARKPEVAAIAARLGIHVDHAFGLCVRFWSWCDDHLENGNARSVTVVTLNAIFERDGFAESLIEVGWLSVSGDAKNTLIVPNYERHLSQNAKRRTLTARRAVTLRSRKSNADSVTKSAPREEKRRDVHPPKEDVLGTAKKRFVPPTVEQVKAYCQERGNTVDPQRFVDFYTSKNWMVGKTKMTDWRAAIRSTWEPKEHGNGKSTNGTDLFAGLRASREAEIGNAG